MKEMDWNETKQRLEELSGRKFGDTPHDANLSDANLSDANLSRANLQFTGLFSFTAGCHFGFYVPWQRYLKIGCVGGSLEWWLENYEEAGAENDYSDADTERYGAIIRMIAELYPAE